ncbi:MAG TPA: cyclic nucleotide-binding domain-containing protein, partial [Pyrinomonadaceae bacterium]|nr:cyclic nucleotide-binding domain-containing protein [Pyrinomonadaceae bacterium]
MPTNAATLAQLKIFETLSDEDRSALAEVIDEMKVPEAQTLFQAGEPGDALFVVRAGEIELYIKDTVGQKIVLNVATAGDMFGEVALLDSGARTATAIALSDSELLVLDRDDLMLLFQKRPEAALHMLGVMSGMTRKADELLRTRVSRNVNEEVQEPQTLLVRIAD